MDGDGEGAGRDEWNHAPSAPRSGEKLRVTCNEESNRVRPPPPPPLTPYTGTPTTSSGHFVYVSPHQPAHGGGAEGPDEEVGERHDKVDP